MDLQTLKVDSIELSFNQHKVLRDVYLQCSQGEIVGLLGRNGCGKSSLLKIIFGALKPAYRHVSINGEYVKKGYHQNRIAYLPQHNYLPTGIKIEKLAKVLVEPSAWAEFAELPAYKEHDQQSVMDLSGGELRQLEMLLVLYSAADFILLDEPFTHISPIQADLFKPIIKRRAKSKGIILTDHQYYNILEVSDRIILLTNGCTRPIKYNEELVTYGYLSAL